MAHQESASLRKAIASSDLCTLFAVAFRFPDEALADALCSGTFMSDLIDCLNEAEAPDNEIQETKELLSQMMLDCDSVGLLAEMRREHSRLYDIPGKFTKIYIFEGPFRFVADGQKGKPSLFLSPITADVKKQMIEAGVIPKNHEHEPVDSIYSELEFMAFMLAQFSESLRIGDDSIQLEWANRIKRFKQEHLEKWVPDFMEKTVQEASAASYKNLALLAGIAMEYILREDS